MTRADPFTGYSWLLRTLIFVVIPAFGVWQFYRLRRAFHIFQLESYKRHWFRRWIAQDRRRRTFAHDLQDAKKPLAMTGRAWRTIVAGAVLSALCVYVPSGIAHISAGFPLDVITCAAMLALVWTGTPEVLLATDVLLTPVQAAINAAYVRRAARSLRAAAPVVVGITGSYGKTSTKRSVATLLRSRGSVLETPGSFNTTLGVVRTINESLKPGDDFFVVEMGARQEGDIAEICELVHPSIGVLTAVGPAHLESFGSLDAIRRGKYELIRSLPASGVAVMNCDDDNVRALADETSHARVVRYGLDEEGSPDVTAVGVSTSTKGTAFTVVDRRSGAEAAVETRLLGRHAVGHVLAALAVGLEAGGSLEELAAACAALEPVEHRLQIIEGRGGVTVIDDAYNSNPEGAAAALEVLDQMPGGRKVVVTPGMVELGDMQREANEAFGERAAAVADTLFVVAGLNREALVAGAERSPDCRVIVVDSLSDATAQMSGLIGPGDVVLFENDLPDQYEG